jgi:urease accessory protein
MAWPTQHHGYLALDLVCHDGRTSIAHQRFCPPLQIFGVQEADRYGGAYLQILNPCGGLFEGDSAEVEVSLHHGAHLYLTTQAATKLYPAAYRQVSRQRIRLRIAAGAILEYFPLPLIPFAQARYAQEIEVQVESGGVCLLAEILAPGRIARGERFAYCTVRSRVQGWVDDQLVLFEQLMLQPEQNTYAGLGVLDGPSYVATLYILTSQDLNTKVPEWNRRLAESHSECVGISALAHGGLVVRLLGQTAQTVLKRLDGVHRLIREEGFGLPRLQVYRPFE